MGCTCLRKRFSNPTISPTLQQSSASQKYRYQRRLRARTSGAVARCTEACERPGTATKTFHYEASKTSTPLEPSYRPGHGHYADAWSQYLYVDAFPIFWKSYVLNLAPSSHRRWIKARENRRQGISACSRHGMFAGRQSGPVIIVTDICKSKVFFFL